MKVFEQLFEVLTGPIFSCKIFDFQLLERYFKPESLLPNITDLKAEKFPTVMNHIGTEKTTKWWRSLTSAGRLLEIKGFD